MSNYSAKFSRRIVIISNLAMFSVVLIHSNSILSYPEAGVGNRYIHYLFAECLCSWAVPFFYVVSGFFFGAHYGQSFFSINDYREILKKKIQTLGIPYFLWSIIGFLLFLPTILSSVLITDSSMTVTRIFGTASICDAIFSFWGVLNESGPSFDRPLWYVRTLLLFFIFSPLWFLMLKKKIGLCILYALIPILILWYAEYTVPHIIWKAGSLGYFLLGMLLARRKCTDFKVENVFSPKITVVFFIGWGIWSIVVTSLRFKNMDVGHPTVYALCKNLCPILGILFFVAGFQHYLKLLPRFIQNYYDGFDNSKNYLNKTFWCYCMHLPVCRFLIAASLYFFGKNDLTCICSFFLVPILSVSVCVGIAVIYKKIFPRTYDLLSGCRG